MGEAVGDPGQRVTGDVAHWPSVDEAPQPGVGLRHGRTDTALVYLQTAVRPKNTKQLEALVTYLEKHQAEIIDYGRRQRAGKPIGSGRMEKGVDQVIGARQKHKGMSWSPTGSKALGILKVVELNQQWEQLWFPQQAAA